MQSEHWKPRKVVIVGAGAVGSTLAYTLALRGLADEIVLLDANREFAMGQVLDLEHGQAFFPSIRIRVGEPADYADASLIVITAGAKQRPGESRLELVQRNARIIEGLMDEIVAQQSPAVVLIVSNPVDVLTYVAHRRSGWRRGRVIGSGTVLDSARFRHLLAKRCGVDVHNVHAHIMGEHGDSEFAAWSITNMAGMPYDQFCRLCARCDDSDEMRRGIVHEVRHSAYHIIGYKGATWFAVALALTQIAGAVLRNQHSVLTVSAVLDGEYGLQGVSLGVPCTVSWKGVEQVLQVDLPPDERDALARSAHAMRQIIDGLQS
ncbi:MAG: L-lactate dehydrogenase [Alphaproteobacteria bacterium]|nr:L-lactate dehydrogenase [Alphaproteobacteria bacterium]